MTLLKVLCIWLMLFFEHFDCVNEINVKFFRTDYKAVEGVFYKYHDNDKTWQQAKEICEYEGASLFHPESQKQLESIRQLFDKEDSQEKHDLHVEDVDINSLPNFKINFDSTKEEKGCQFLSTSSIGRDCTKMAHFVCQKPMASVQWNKDCDMPAYSGDDKGYGYEYNSNLEKCYKLHTVPKTWQKADEICKAEQTSLAELNSQEEANHLVELVSRVPEEQVGVVCLGFKQTEGGWELLSGKMLHESGYPMWAYTQPDGDGFEGFGAMAYNGRLHDIAQDSTCIFVCESKFGTN